MATVYMLPNSLAFSLKDLMTRPTDDPAPREGFYHFCHPMLFMDMDRVRNLPEQKLAREFRQAMRRHATLPVHPAVPELLNQLVYDEVSQVYLQELPVEARREISRLLDVDIPRARTLKLYPEASAEAMKQLRTAAKGLGMNIDDMIHEMAVEMLPLRDQLEIFANATVRVVQQQFFLPAMFGSQEECRALAVGCVSVSAGAEGAYEFDVDWQKIQQIHALQCARMEAKVRPLVRAAKDMVEREGEKIEVPSLLRVPESEHSVCFPLSTKLRDRVTHPVLRSLMESAIEDRDLRVVVNGNRGVVASTFYHPHLQQGLRKQYWRLGQGNQKYVQKNLQQGAGSYIPSLHIISLPYDSVNHEGFAEFALREELGHAAINRLFGNFTLPYPRDRTEDAGLQLWTALRQDFEAMDAYFGFSGAYLSQAHGKLKDAATIMQEIPLKVMIDLDLGHLTPGTFPHVERYISGTLASLIAEQRALPPRPLEDVYRPTAHLPDAIQHDAPLNPQAPVALLHADRVMNTRTESYLERTSRSGVSAIR